MKYNETSFGQRARNLREVIRHYETRSPVDYMVEGSVQKGGIIRVPKNIVENFMKLGYLDPICYFLIQDGSVLIMEKGLAEERIGGHFGDMLPRTNKKYKD